MNLLLLARNAIGQALLRIWFLTLIPAAIAARNADFPLMIEISPEKPKGFFPVRFCTFRGVCFMKKLTYSRVKAWGLRATGAGVALAATGSAMAADDLSTLFDTVDLSGISAKIMALAVTIVGIALVIKGPSIVKRLISKI